VVSPLLSNGDPIPMPISFFVGEPFLRAGLSEAFTASTREAPEVQLVLEVAAKPAGAEEVKEEVEEEAVAEAEADVDVGARENDSGPPRRTPPILKKKASSLSALAALSLPCTALRVPSRASSACVNENTRLYS